MKRKMKLAHPGELLKMEIEARSLTVTDASALLDTTRSNLSNIVHCKAAISPVMAIKIAHQFGGTPRLWNQLQASYNLDVTERTFNVEFMAAV